MLDLKRHWFKDIETLIGKTFGVFPLTPNQYTYLSGVFAIIGVVFMMKHDLIWSLFFFLIAAFNDLIDGAVARSKDLVTTEGAYLDTVFDRYVEGIMLFGLFFLPLPQVWLPTYVWIYLALFGSIVTTYSKAAAKEKNVNVRNDLKGGLLSRAERMILLFLAIISAIVNPDLTYVVYIIIVIAVFTNLTAAERISSAVYYNK